MALTLLRSFSSKNQIKVSARTNLKTLRRQNLSGSTIIRSTRYCLRTSAITPQIDSLLADEGSDDSAIQRERFHQHHVAGGDACQQCARCEQIQNGHYNSSEPISSTRNHHFPDTFTRAAGVDDHFNFIVPGEAGCKASWRKSGKPSATAPRQTTPSARCWSPARRP